MRAKRQRVRALEDISRRQMVAVRGTTAIPQSGLSVPSDAELAVALEDIPAGRWGLVERWIEGDDSKEKDEDESGKT